MRRIVKTSVSAELRSEHYRRTYNVSDAGVPLILDSTGHVFWPFTDYLLYLFINYHKKTGTLRTYANHLSLFQRYIEEIKISLGEVNGQIVVDFRNYLLKDPRPRSNNQINSIIRRTFDAMRLLQRQGYFGDRLVIGSSEGQIRLHIKEAKYYDKRQGTLRTRNVFAHPALLPRSPRQPRYPIASETITALWACISKLTNNKFRQQRLRLLLSCLEQTGCRRIEVSRITVEDIKAAVKTHRLKMSVAKTRLDHSEREVAIPRELITRAVAFIHCERKEVIKNAQDMGHLDADPGLLFVTIEGLPWQPQSISDELYDLKVITGLDTPAHAHLFRHRWVSIQASAKAETLKDTPLARSTLAARLCSDGGWRSLEGPSPYIDGAFDENGYWEAGDQLAERLHRNAAIERELLELTRQLRDGPSGEEAKQIGERLTELYAIARTLRSRQAEAE